MLRPTLAACAALFALTLSACSGEEAAGPDVTGMNLPDAKAALKDAGVNATIKSTDTILGVLVEANFVVCKQEAVNENMVRLEVAKHGC